MEAIRSSLKRRRTHGIGAMDYPQDTDAIEHALALCRSLDAMRNEKQNCDVIIKIGKRKIPVHKNVIMAQSDYFNAMFTHDTLEQQTGVVNMKDVRFEPVKKCVDYFYTGKISITEEGCEDLLHTASLMQVKPVCDKVGPFLESRLNPKSFFNIRKIAIKFDLENLTKVCDEFAVGKLDLIVKKQEEFNQLDLDYVSQLLTSKKSSHSGDEDCKLAIVLQWVKADFDSRTKHLCSMINLLDLKKISLGYTRYLAEKESLCNQSNQIMTMLLLAGMDRQKVAATPAKTVFSAGHNAILVFDTRSRHVQAYQPSTKAWCKLWPMRQSMIGVDGCTAVARWGFLFVLMGNSKAYKIDVSDKNARWMEIPDMLYDHGWITAAVNDEYIYVSGNKHLERYSQEKNKWEEVASRGICFNSSTLAEYDGSIFNIGGYRNGFLNTMKSVEPDVSLSSISPLQVSREFPGVTVYDDRLFVAGGTNAGYGVERYDPVSRTWTKLPSMERSRYYFRMICIDDSLYAVGDKAGPCTIEKFDTKSQQWTMEVNKPEMKIKAAASVAITMPE